VTEGAFSDLTAGWPSGIDGGTTGGTGPDVSPLNVAASRLKGICSYLHNAKQPTPTENLDTLCAFLEAVEAYLSGLPANPKGLGDAIKATVEKLPNVRTAVFTLRFMATEREERYSNRNRSLEDLGADFATVMTKQYEVESSLSNFSSDLLRLAVIIGGSGQASSSQIHRTGSAQNSTEGRLYRPRELRRIS
jgi:hypothetical protein